MASERPWVESIAACIADPLVLLRGNGTVLWANREFSRLVGIAEGAKGAEFARFVEQWPALLEHLGETPENGALALAVVLVSQRGERIEVEAHVARCAPGLDARWALHLRDVREVQELRRRLSERERSHSFLQANTSDLIVRTDAAHCVIWRNNNAAVFFPMGSELAALLSEDSAEMLNNGGTGRFDVAIRSRDGVRPAFHLRGIARKLADEEGMPIGMSILLRDDSEGARLAKFVADHQLSAREEEIVEYVVRGYSNLNIASILGISESGVKFHLRNVFARVKVNTRTELAALLLKEV